MKKSLVLSVTILFAAFCSAQVWASSTKPLPPIPTPYTQVTPPADPSHFEFIVGGDNRSPGHGFPMPKSLKEICKEIGWIHPPFSLWTGDSIEGYGDTPSEADAEYSVFLKSAALTGTPIFSAPGNHEFALDPALLPVYLKRMGPLYGSFDYGNSHFIALDTTTPNPDGTIRSGTLDPAQWAWLESDLQANQGAANIFVFLHHYVFGPPDPDTPNMDTGWISIADRDRMHALMVKYHVRAVFCGHAHLYWHKKIDGVDYYVTGGSGAPLDATPDQGGFLHYLLINVDGTTVTSQILQPWHLMVYYPDGKSSTSQIGRVWFANTNDFSVQVNRIIVHMATPPAGEKLTAAGAIVSKKKRTPVPVQIESITPSGAGADDVAVSVDVPRSSPVHITITPAPAKE